MKLSRNPILFVAVVLLLIGSACGSKTTNTANSSKGNTTGETSIPQLQQQVSLDSLTLHELQVNYQSKLQSDFHWCDSMLSFVNEQKLQDYFDILNLAQAYLDQFNTMLPVMNHDIAYLQTQLINLQNDIDSHYINDSLATAYLADEQAVADTLHHRVLYFQDRLSQQDQELQSLKKHIRKEL